MKEPFENNDLNKKFEDFSYPVGDANWDAISARIPSGNGDGFLSEKFAAHAVLPSRNVWRGVETTLQPASRRRIAVWWWYGAAAAVFLFGYFAFQQFDGSADHGQVAHQETEKIIENKSDAETTTQDIEPLTTENSNAASNSSSAKANTTAIPATPTTIKAEKQNNISKSGNAQAENTLELDKTDKQEANQEMQLTVAGNRGANESNSITPGGNQRMIPMGIVGIDTEIETPDRTAVLAGEMITIEPTIDQADNKKQKSSKFYDGTETASENQFAILAGSQLAFAGNGNTDMAESSNFSVATGINPSEGTYLSDNSFPNSITYSTPIYYGVNGEIKFWKRLSAGIGLGYLRMQTTVDFDYGHQTKARETDSKYLSIPVYLKFNFIDKPKFTAYTTAGNAIDLVIWQETTETFTDGQFTESRSVSNEPKGNQANLYAGLGMSYKFTKHLGVFAEGSLMRYYSITGTNFYSQQNLWPGMRFGVLVSF